MNKVLIAYASKCGATEDTVQQIASTLRNKYGLEVDTVNLRHGAHPDFSEYSHVVVGSGIRMKKWYKEAQNFLKNDFQGKNVALFVCSMYEGGNPQTYQTAMERLEKVSAEYLRSKPFAVEVFGGRMRFAGRLTSDNLDTNQICAWTQVLGEKIASSQLGNATGA
jgi:menaquinone-dependent protoporphyrinogen oxidase